MARPFVDSMTEQQTADAALIYEGYLAVRRTSSIKALAAAYGVKPLTMYRRIAAYKEKHSVPRN
jgi:hypothetical protein